MRSTRTHLEGSQLDLILLNVGIADSRVGMQALTTGSRISEGVKQSIMIHYRLLEDVSDRGWSLIIRANGRRG
jgi:hypothetical protein